jgi:hypothetical protein
MWKGLRAPLGFECRAPSHKMHVVFSANGTHELSFTRPQGGGFQHFSNEGHSKMDFQACRRMQIFPCGA